MFKFKEIGMYKNAVNIPYCKIPATITAGVKNGYIVTFSETDKAIALPTSTTAKAAGLTVVMNRYDKPELEKPNDYVVEVGEFPRLFTLKSIAGRVVQMDMDAITTARASIAVGDKLVAGTDGKLVEAADITGYSEYFEVTALDPLGVDGVEAVVHA